MRIDQDRGGTEGIGVEAISEMGYLENLFEFLSLIRTFLYGTEAGYKMSAFEQTLFYCMSICDGHFSFYSEYAHIVRSNKFDFKI